MASASEKVSQAAPTASIAASSSVASPSYSFFGTKPMEKPVEKEKPRTGNCVYIESPFSGSSDEDMKKNIRYGQYIIQDCLKRGESPFLSHLLYTQLPKTGFVRNTEQLAADAAAEFVSKQQSVKLAYEWRARANKTIVYTDRGITSGMASGVNHAYAVGSEVEFRSIPDIEKKLNE
jgi:hypothetical protein